MKSNVKWYPIGEHVVNGKVVAKSFCKYYRSLNNNDWESIPNVTCLRSSEKAEYINVILVDAYNEDNYNGIEMQFWCPRKFVKGFGSCTIPLWFLEKKVEECFA